jgi:hypothetical protein
MLYPTAVPACEWWCRACEVPAGCATEGERLESYGFDKHLEGGVCVMKYSRIIGMARYCALAFRDLL